MSAYRIEFTGGRVSRDFTVVHGDDEEHAKEQFAKAWPQARIVTIEPYVQAEQD